MRKGHQTETGRKGGSGGSLIRDGARIVVLVLNVNTHNAFFKSACLKFRAVFKQFLYNFYVMVLLGCLASSSVLFTFITRINSQLCGERSECK
jgi:hypothetical protein